MIARLKARKKLSLVMLLADFRGCEKRGSTCLKKPKSEMLEYRAFTVLRDFCRFTVNTRVNSGCLLSNSVHQPYETKQKKGLMLTKIVILALASVYRSISTPVTMTIKPVPKVSETKEYLAKITHNKLRLVTMNALFQSTSVSEAIVNWIEELRWSRIQISRLEPRIFPHVTKSRRRKLFVH